MLSQFSCWTAALPPYLWFGSCSITTYFLPLSPLPGFNERKGEHHPLGNTHFIGLGLRWKSHKRSVDAVLTSSFPQREQFQFAWSPREPRGASNSFTHPSWSLPTTAFMVMGILRVALGFPQSVGLSQAEPGSHACGSQFGTSAAKFPQSLLHWQWFLWKADVWLDGLIQHSILLLVVVSCTWL